MNKEIIDIEDRQNDYDFINNEVWRAELGIRSICIMYDEHSADKKSKDNIFLLKDNIHYRLFSAVHQNLIFLKDLSQSESYLQNIHEKEPNLLRAFPFGNPYFDKVELELSSVFDSIIFQLSSVFDYLSHMICYICKMDKSKTLYWTKLATSVRGNDNEFSKLNISNIIDEVDRNFIGRLYDYRSRLLHNKRDKHNFTTEVNLTISNINFKVKILASDIALKHFKIIRILVPKESDITLTYLASWLLKQTFLDIERILESLRFEILRNSNFHNNLIKPKIENSFMIGSLDPKTNKIIPLSEILWSKYKKRS